jgi:hypothetical protein
MQALHGWQRTAPSKSHSNDANHAPSNHRASGDAQTFQSSHVIHHHLMAQIGHRQMVVVFFKKVLKFTSQRPNLHDEAPSIGHPHKRLTTR